MSLYAQPSMHSGAYEIAPSVVRTMFMKGFGLSQQQEDDEETTADRAGGPSTLPSEDGSWLGSPMSGLESRGDGGFAGDGWPLAPGNLLVGAVLGGVGALPEAGCRLRRLPDALHGQLTSSSHLASLVAKASRKVSFAEPTTPQEPINVSGSPPQQPDIPMKVPAPAYGMPEATALPADSARWKKRPIFHELAGWKSHAAATMYPDQPIHKRPSGFLLAEPPRMFA
mmetsp:Transcript_21507/g.61470  ORF Transcript_21507/g.61470 Transcript_21507/m.61470 type:complete len:226 (+) Transcript_21507:102-779(+)